MTVQTNLYCYSSLASAHGPVPWWFGTRYFLEQLAEHALEQSLYESLYCSLAEGGPHEWTSKKGKHLKNTPIKKPKHLTATGEPKTIKVLL